MYGPLISIDKKNDNASSIKLWNEFQISGLQVDRDVRRCFVIDSSQKQWVRYLDEFGLDTSTVVIDTSNVELHFKTQYLYFHMAQQYPGSLWPNSPREKSLIVYNFLKDSNFDQIIFLSSSQVFTHCLKARQLGLAFQKTSLVVVVDATLEQRYVSTSTLPQSLTDLENLEFQSIGLLSETPVVTDDICLATLLNDSLQEKVQINLVAPARVALRPGMTIMLNARYPELISRFRDFLKNCTVVIGTQFNLVIEANNPDDRSAVDEIRSILIEKGGKVTEGFLDDCTDLREKCFAVYPIERGFVFAAYAANRGLSVISSSTSYYRKYNKWVTIIPPDDLALNPTDIWSMERTSEFEQGHLGSLRTFLDYQVLGYLDAPRSLSLATSCRQKTAGHALGESNYGAEGRRRARESDGLACTKLSVIMPTFNRTRELLEAVQSLDAQTFCGPFELILVDDGSSDKQALDIIESIAKDEDRHYAVKVIRQQNSGPAVARNLGASVSSADYLLFMDDDNVALPEELEVLIHAADHSGADILTVVPALHPASDRWASEGESIWRGPEEESRTGASWLPLGGSLSVGSAYNCFGDNNALFRRSAFNELGGYRGPRDFVFEDYELFFRAMLSGYRIELVPEILYQYRAHVGSRSQRWRLAESAAWSIDSLGDTPVGRALAQLALLHKQSILAFEYSRFETIGSQVGEGS